MITTTATAPLTPTYTNDAQQRLMSLVITLAGHELHGLAPADIIRLTGHTAAQVTRDMANLEQGEWAERITNTGRWRLGPAIVRIGVKYAVAADQAMSRIQQMHQRYSANV